MMNFVNIERIMLINLKISLKNKKWFLINDVYSLRYVLNSLTSFFDFAYSFHIKNNHHPG